MFFIKRQSGEYWTRKGWDRDYHKGIVYGSIAAANLNIPGRYREDSFAAALTPKQWQELIANLRVNEIIDNHQK